jgi:phenylacetate-CoA ligase
MGALSGAEYLGASVIPASGLAPRRQAQVLGNYRVTVLVATPSQALHLGRFLRDVDRPSLSLRRALIVGQVWSAQLREEIEALLEVEAYGSYGLSEMAVPGLATECGQRNGLHLAEDNVLAEVLDPATGRPAPVGQPGELVLTTLTREAVPMIRYRTGDITVLHEGACACGRAMIRMEPTHARTDDIVIVNGIRVAPHQVEDVVDDILPGAACSLSVSDQEGMEGLEIRVAIDPSRFEDEIRHMEMLREHIKVHILEHLGLRATVRLVETPRKPR